MTDDKLQHAILVTAYEKAELIPEPRTEGVGSREVAGRTLVTLISPGTEIAAGYQAASFPRRPGYAAVFEVLEVGSEISDLQRGDQVFCMGPHQSYQRKAREQVVPLPKGLPPEEAVFARIMGIGMTTLTTTAARPPDQVLVIGLGLVGNLTAQVFAACGYEVLACGHRAARRHLASRVGIRRVFADVPEDDPLLVGHIGLVVDCSGHEEAVLGGCRVVRKGGEVVLVGVPWRRMAECSAHELLHAIFHRYVVLRSGWEWELPDYATDFCANSIYGSFAAALAWLAEGRVHVDELYDRLSPHEAQKAYQALLHRSCPQLTVLFDWRCL